MDEIIYTILDLEQFIGKEIKWVTGETFEQIIKNHSGYLPNKMARYCTTEMKILPMFNYLNSLKILPVEMNLGFRPNETIRIENVLNRADENGNIRGAQTSNYSGFEIGLTKREYFTAKAMHAILSNPEWMKEYKGDKYLMQKIVVAALAIGYADKVLKKLSPEEVTEQ